MSNNKLMEAAADILASMIDMDPTGEVQELYDFVASRGL